MGVKCGLQHNKIQDIYKITRRHHHLYKKYFEYTGIKKKSIGFKKNIKKHGLPFHYNIRKYPMLGIGYVAVRQKPCKCSECLRKMASP